MEQKTIKFLLILNLIVSGTLCLLFYMHSIKIPDFSNEVIKARGVVVTDSLGIERIIIGAPLPDPTYIGERFPRQGDVSGILLFDSEGQERSGYVTDNDYGNVFLTLDSKSSQQALFIAEPQDGATLMMFAKNKNMISLGAYSEGTELEIRNGGRKENRIVIGAYPKDTEGFEKGGINIDITSNKKKIKLKSDEN
jgi:hypothetical protein